MINVHARFLRLLARSEFESFVHVLTDVLAHALGHCSAGDG